MSHLSLKLRQYSPRACERQCVLRFHRRRWEFPNPSFSSNRGNSLPTARPEIHTQSQRMIFVPHAGPTSQCTTVSNSTQFSVGADRCIFTVSFNASNGLHRDWHRFARLHLLTMSVQVWESRDIRHIIFTDGSNDMSKINVGNFRPAWSTPSNGGAIFMGLLCINDFPIHFLAPPDRNTEDISYNRTLVHIYDNMPFE